MSVVTFGAPDTMGAVNFGARETGQMPSVGAQYKLAEFDHGDMHYWLYVNFPATLMTIVNLGRGKVDELLKRLAAHKDFLVEAFTHVVEKRASVKEFKSYRTMLGSRFEKVVLQDDKTPDPNAYELALGKLIEKLFQSASFTMRTSKRGSPDTLHGKDIPALGAPADVSADLTAINEFKAKSMV